MNSYVIMNAKDLRNMCCNIVHSIEAYRQSKWRQVVEERVQEHKGSWIRRILGSAVMSKAEAEEDLKRMDDYYYSVYNGIMTSGWQAMDKIRELLAATEVSSVVYVTAKDLRLLKDWS